MPGYRRPKQHNKSVNVIDIYQTLHYDNREQSFLNIKKFAKINHMWNYKKVSLIFMEKCCELQPLIAMQYNYSVCQ